MTPPIRHAFKYQGLFSTLSQNTRPSLPPKAMTSIMDDLKEV